MSDDITVVLDVFPSLGPVEEYGRVSLHILEHFLLLRAVDLGQLDLGVLLAEEAGG